MNDDSLLGYQVLNTFLKYFNSTYGRSLKPDDIAKAINSKHPEVIVDGLGLQYRNVLEIDSSKLDSAMKYLSDLSQNRIPDFMSFSTIMSREAQRMDTWGYIFNEFTFVTEQSVKEVASGAQAIGNSVINTGKLLTWLLPAGVITFIYFYGKNTLKRVS